MVSSDFLMIWIALTTMFFLMEIFNPTLFFFLSFVMGGIAATGGTYWGLPFPNQCILFISASGISFGVLYHLSYDLRRSSTKTNAEALIGASGIVTETIDGDHPGRVKIRGEEWRAITDQGSALHPHTHIIVIAIVGNRLTVRRRT